MCDPRALETEDRRVDGVGSPVAECEEPEMRAHKLETSRSGTKRDRVERYKLV